jgi:hypothetical protein
MERGNLYGANAMAEAARMGALGNLGSASIGAFGSASNSAMDAWARNQQAYNQAAAGMHMATQSGLGNAASAASAAGGNIGAAQAMATGNVGAAQAAAQGNVLAARANAAGQLGRAQMIGNALGGLGLGGVGGSFSAGGPGGPIASGNYSGSPQGSMTGVGGGGPVDWGGEVSMGGPSFAGQGGGGGGDMGMAQQAEAGRAQLDRQHMSSRDMPKQFMDSALSGLRELGTEGYSQIGRGMDQFYGAQGRAGDQFMGALGGLSGGATGGFKQTQADLRSGMMNTAGGINSLFDRSLGHSQYSTPAQAAERNREAQVLGQQYRDEDLSAGYRRTLADPGPSFGAGLFGPAARYAASAQQQHLRSQQEAKRGLARMGL